MVPPGSGRIPPVPPYSGYHPAPRGFRVRDCHPLRCAFPGVFRYPLGVSWWSYNPRGASTPRVWALPLSLATTRGITVVFSSSPYLDVSVRGVRLHSRGWPASCRPGCPIRTSRDQGPFAATPGFSQLVTSFIASGSPGIRRAPLDTSRIRTTTPPRLAAGGATRVPACSVARVRKAPRGRNARRTPPLFLSCLLPACQRTAPRIAWPKWRIRDSNP